MIPVAKPQLGPEERDAVLRVLMSGCLAQGPEVEAFEREFSAEALDGRPCIAVNSGTSAQHLTMLALGIGQGDEVIVPSFTFAATANSVALTGATPIFVDIDPATFNIDCSHVEAAITPRTRAVMPVHLYGQSADMERLSEICSRYGLHLVEDAAQAHLATWAGKSTGTWGIAGTFSFYPTKNMTTGEGGLVSTADETVARHIRLLRNQGQETRYHNEIVGLNNRMTDIHAAIGRVQLGRLRGFTARRRQIAAFFDENLRGVQTPVVDPSAEHVYHQYTIRVVGHDRDEFSRELAKFGVSTGTYYPVPVHRLPPFDSGLHLEQTERAASEVLSLPVFPGLTDSEVDQIVAAVNRVASSGA